MTYSHDPHLLDNAFSDDPILSNLIQATEEIERDLRFYWFLFQLGKIGPWEQTACDLLYLSDIWCKVFGIEDAPSTLEDYALLIDNESDRTRILDARSQLHHQTVGTRWSATYTLCGRKIRSIVLVMQDGTIAGFDQIIDNGGM